MEMPNTYATQLLEAGFLEYAEPEAIERLKIALLNEFDIYDDTANKAAHIDAEELAEGNLNFFVPGLHHLLGKRQFILEVQLAGDFETTHQVMVNDRLVELFNDAELENDTFWETAPRNFFMEVNRQLNEAAIDERFYFVNGGNDLHVLLLTQTQYNIIHASYKNDLHYAPYPVG